MLRKKGNCDPTCHGSADANAPGLFDADNTEGIVDARGERCCGAVGPPQKERTALKVFLKVVTFSVE